MLIEHPRKLLYCRFIARYDRFIAVVALRGREVEAHCVNPGRMEGLVRTGCEAWVSEAPTGSRRKLRYTLELMRIDGVMIGVNTQLPNTLAEVTIRQRLVPGMRRYTRIQREVPYGSNSRVDLLLHGRRPHYVEVKNCHLVYPDGGAYFPDSVSARATAHLEELAAVAEAGYKASVLFVVQRDDGTFLRPSALHDPQFARAARSAKARGVRFSALRFAPGAAGFEFLGMMPVDLNPYDPAALQGFRDAMNAASGWQRRGRIRDI